MKANLLKLAAVNAVIAAIVSTASAAELYDQNVVAGNADGSIAAGTTLGPSGIANGGFAVVTDGTIQLGLRGKLDHQNVFPDNGNGIYVVPSGNGTSGTRASWNYEFSLVALSGNLGAYTYSLLLDTDPSAGTSFVSYDPSNPALGPGTSTIIQGSENAAFALPYGEGTTFANPGLYDIELIATPKSGGAALTDTIQINVTPEATSTLPLLGAAVVGLALVGRKMKAKTA